MQIPGVKIIAVTDINNGIAAQMAKENDANVYADLETFLENENIDLVYIATLLFALSAIKNGIDRRKACDLRKTCSIENK